MKQVLFLSGLLVIIFLSSGCEGYRCGKGKVVDKLTNTPLDSVFCEVITGYETYSTDSTGNFDLCNKFGSCVPKCKDIQIRFSKSGYRTVTIENPYDETVFLER